MKRVDGYHRFNVHGTCKARTTLTIKAKSQKAAVKLAEKRKVAVIHVERLPDVVRPKRARQPGSLVWSQRKRRSTGKLFCGLALVVVAILVATLNDIMVGTMAGVAGIWVMLGGRLT